MNVGTESLNGYERNLLYRNLGGGRFADHAYVAGADRIEDARGVVACDVDEDGKLDILIQNFERDTLLLSNRGAAGHWLQLRLRGTRSNRDAVGARVVIAAGEARQTREVGTTSGYVSGQSLLLHFGLGGAERVDRIEVFWPSGARTVIEGAAADQRLTIVEDPT